MIFSRTKLLSFTFALSLLMFVVGSASGQEMSRHSGLNVTDMKLVNISWFTNLRSRFRSEWRSYKGSVLYFGEGAGRVLHPLALEHQ